MARVVVIGAGLSGLATAARLADFGHDVIVFEQAPQAGGRLTAVVHDGLVYDPGPAQLTLPAVYRDLFRKTGRPLERVVDLIPSDPAWCFGFADGTRVELPNASRHGVRRALDDALGAGSGLAWQAVVDDGRQAWQALRSPYLEAAPSAWDLVGLARGPRRRTLEPRRTLRSLVRKLVPDPRLRIALEHTVAGADPRRAPAALAIVPYLIETFGRWQVAGGMHRLVEAVHDRAVERGARVVTRSAVTGIDVGSGRATGVRLAGGKSERADVVVAAVDAHRLYGRLLPPAAGRRARARLRRYAPAPARFTLLLAVTAGVQNLPPHQVLLPSNADVQLDAVFGDRPAPPDEPAIDLFAPGEPGDGGRAVTAQVTVPPHGRLDWSSPALAQDYAEKVLAVMAARGLDVRPGLRSYAIRTPYDVEQATDAAFGAAWGLGVGTAWELLRRPGNRTPVDGLFHVGSSAYPGPGLPLVGLSSAIVADLIGRA